MRRKSKWTFIAGEQNSLDEKIVDIITSIGSNNSAGPNQSTGLYHEIEILKQSMEQPKNQTKSKFISSMYYCAWYILQIKLELIARTCQINHLIKELS